MFGLLVWAGFMIVFSAFFWYYEITPWLEGMVQPKQSNYSIIRFFERLRVGSINLYRLTTDGKFLLTDVFVTISITSVMGFGQAVIGGVIGLTVSNAVSVLIFIIMNKRKKKAENV